MQLQVVYVACMRNKSLSKKPKCIDKNIIRREALPLLPLFLNIVTKNFLLVCTLYIHQMIPGNLLNDKVYQKKLFNCPEDNLILAMNPLHILMRSKIFQLLFKIFYFCHFYTVLLTGLVNFYMFWNLFLI